MNNNAADLFNVRSHNPSFFSVIKLISERLPEILRYYPDCADVHAKHIGEIAGVSPDCIVPAKIHRNHYASMPPYSWSNTHSDSFVSKAEGSTAATRSARPNNTCVLQYRQKKQSIS